MLLQRNQPCFVFLSLLDFNIHDEGAKAFADLFRSSTPLLKLNLLKPPISEAVDLELRYATFDHGKEIYI